MLTKNCRKGDRKKESATSIDGHEPELKAAYAIFHQGVGALTSDTFLGLPVLGDRKAELTWRLERPLE